MKDYKKLIVWQKAHLLVLSIYKTTRDFPAEEKFNLISQIRRAATSIPTNISEGCGKFTQKDFAKFLQDAFGSAQEVEYLAFLSFELEYFKKDVYSKIDKDVNEIKAMLISLLKKIRKELQP
ncbi:MAG TPA: four helix bundle protein [Ohtaekwangia sp.]